MKVIGGPRRSGRTTRLIELCHEAESTGTPSYIVCHSTDEAHRIFELASEMEKPIAFPITYDELKAFHGAPTQFNFYIDNAEYLLQKLLSLPYNIDAIAITVDEILSPTSKKVTV